MTGNSGLLLYSELIILAKHRMVNLYSKKNNRRGEKHVPVTQLHATQLMLTVLQTGKRQTMQNGNRSG